MCPCDRLLWDSSSLSLSNSKYPLKTTLLKHDSMLPNNILTKEMLSVLQSSAAHVREFTCSEVCLKRRGEVVALISP